MGHARSSLSTLVARWATELLSPFVLLAAVLVWVAWLTDPAWVRTAVVAVGFISAVPLCISLLMTHAGTVTDKYIRHRAQRHLFYAISLGSMLTGAALVIVLDSSVQARWMVGFAVGTLLVVMLINTRLKISIHALIAALAAVAFPAGLPHPGMVAAAVGVWALASWSRVRLARHSLIEVLCGSALGAVVGFSFLGVVGGLPSP